MTSTQRWAISSTVRSPVADPLLGVGVVRVIRRIIVPRRNDQRRPLREKRLVAIGVDVVVVPVPLEVVDYVDDFLPAIRIDRLQHHRLAAHVHVRLEVLEASRRLQHVEILCDGDFARRNVKVRLALAIHALSMVRFCGT